MISFLSTLFGCTKKNISDEESIPTENFSLIEAKLLDGRPAVGMFNQSYKNYAKKDEYPWCLKISIALELNNLFENGLPKEGEKNIAVKVEDELLTEIKKITTPQYVGHLFNDSFLDVYIYLDEPKKVFAFLEQQGSKKRRTREFGYQINEDPKWTSVMLFMK